MPINYDDYPENWFSELRPAVLKRANNACEACGVHNYRVVRWNDAEGRYEWYDDIVLATTHKKALGQWLELMAGDYYADWLIIVLTIAHLDHNTENNELTNLKALCQRCHLNHDRPDNTLRKKYGKNYAKHQLKLF